DLHVDVTASAPAPPPVGSELDFFVTVSSKNVGGSTDVRLDLTLPTGWTYSHSYADRGPGCAGTPPNLSCDVAFINPSATTHVQLYGTVSQAGELDLTATATSLLEPEANPADNTFTLKLVPAAPPAPTPTPTPTPSPLPVPKLIGTAKIGSTLHVVPLAGARYQWQLCTSKVCVPIKGATKPRLTLLKSYAGERVRILVTLRAKRVASRMVTVRPHRRS
ncbi:MAG TPA: hypothetical protein VF091_07845, partial [Gaiellaceae bacterium]